MEGFLASERRPIAGSILGVLVFLAGVAVIFFVFQQAFAMFLKPPMETLQIEPGKPMNLNNTANSLLMSLLKVILLVVMAGIGSMIANRGIKMYSSAPPPHPPKNKPKPEALEKE